MLERTFIAEKVSGVFNKRDNSATLLNFGLGASGNLSVQLPASQVPALMRSLLAAATALPATPQSPTGGEKGFPVLRYEIGVGFPDDVGLILETPPFGRQGFALPVEAAKRLAGDLRECAEQIEKDQSNPGPKH